MTVQEMLKELYAAGFSQAQVANKVGTTAPTINRATHGADVRYALGKAVEELHRKTLKALRRKAA
jgi:transcriptional regulator with XRE-family HTH domain